MKSERDKIAAKIRALKMMTVENGCTEDEAILAAEKLTEILKRYNMTLDEASLRETPFERHTEYHEDNVGERLWKIADAVSYLTGARYWTSRAGVWPIEINFFGFSHEVDVAKYLLEICAYAMRQEEKRQNKVHALLVVARRRRKVLAFLDGMTDSLWRRIRDLKPEAPTGKGLVVLRGDLIDAAMKDARIETDAGRAKISRDFEATYFDGQQAGDRVSLNRGVNGATETPRLLR